MIKAWCYVCSSWSWCMEFNPYLKFEDGSPMPNHQKHCLLCMKHFYESRLKLEKMKELKLS